MENEAQLLLADVVAFCQRDGVEARLVNMLSQSRAVELTDTQLTVEAPSRFAAAALERNRTCVEAYLEEITFAQIELSVVSPGATGSAGVAPSAGANMLQPAIPAPTSHMTAAARLGTTAQTPAAGPAPVEEGAAPVHEPFAGSQTQAPQKGEHTVSGFSMPFAKKQEDGERGVNVTNTMSAADYKRMLAQMKGEEVSAPAAPATQPVTETPGVAMAVTGPSVPVNSKFTFDNFVYGNENKHAYQSSQRFAAFADVPGQYNSLFIYGDSGLGKTHLLLAIANYLQEHKPNIKVKYANSQAYIDDFINEINRQKTDGRSILREYHEANVLIIDDIQNIIGKQASIEYFFSLMDEFIRENKKIVIASDRAPKNLGMDERITSRFNAGMLCLVSEPGFEMKYTILKRYYENTIKGDNALAGMGMDTSLLDAFSNNEGTLTDDQLRHMAEISGNNIRELESFCERCASLSYEREQMGDVLSNEDIDGVANEYFDTTARVIRVKTIQETVEEFYGVSHEELIGPRRSKDIAFARHVAVYLANDLCDLSSSAIGEEFGGRNHATILNSIKVVETKMKEDRKVCEELGQLKNSIKARS
ncbi:MAG: DnaA/Hda family protein [Coriobacteriaceae bacterium]|nr:DnaA/Hda family protein [Coriobacteriaceae bacterium]